MSTDAPAETPASAPSAAPRARELVARPWRIQLLACVLGLVAGFVPGVSFTGTFWEVQLSQFGPGPVRIDRVAMGSPAARAGLRTGDRISHARGFDGVRDELHGLRIGETRTLSFERDGQPVPITLTGTRPEVAAVWYPTFFHPLAGACFLGLALMLLATAPLRPAPVWRPAVAGGLGFVLAAGFTVCAVGETPFWRLRIWQRWVMTIGNEWAIAQSAIGVLAGVVLVAAAVWELRGILAART